jgi:hypothetical protein
MYDKTIWRAFLACFAQNAGKLIYIIPTMYAYCVYHEMLIKQQNWQASALILLTLLTVRSKWKRYKKAILLPLFSKWRYIANYYPVKIYMLICTCKRYGFHKCNNILSCTKRVNLKQIKKIDQITKYYGHNYLWCSSWEGLEDTTEVIRRRKSKKENTITQKVSEWLLVNAK